MVRIVLLLAGCGLATSCDETVNPVAPEVAQAAASEVPTEVQSDLGVLEIRSTPASALVHLDGRFIGETSRDGPLRVVRPSGTFQIRLGKAHFLDGVHEVDLPARSVLELHATLATEPRDWKRSSDPIEIGVGQVLRGAVGGGENTKLGPVRYVAREPEPTRRVLVIQAGRPRLAVNDPDGNALTLRELEPGIEGMPGTRFLEFDVERAGDYTIEVRGAGTYSVRYVTGVPPRSTATDPRLARRRRGAGPVKPG